MGAIILQVGVKILLQNADNKFLLLHRNVEKYTNLVGEWDIVGGRIDPGTTLLENLEREVLEETKLKIVGEPKLVAAQDILRKEGFHIVRLTYVGRCEGEVSLDMQEHDAYRWHTREELTQLENVDTYLKDVLSKVLDHAVIANNQ